MGQFFQNKNDKNNAGKKVKIIRRKK